MLRSSPRVPTWLLGTTLTAVLATAAAAQADPPTENRGSMPHAVALGDTAHPPTGDTAASDRGFVTLTRQPLLSSDLSDTAFDAVWQSWPEPLREAAAAASPVERRRMAFERYGLTPLAAADASPRGDSSLLLDTREPASGSELWGVDVTNNKITDPIAPLQYVVDDEGVWTMNCFACHGGTVYGAPWPGAPNNRFDLQTMTEELRAAKLRNGITLSRMDFGALVIPLGTTHGTTNAVVFGQGLMSRRDKDLNVISAAPGAFTNHDMDAPPWWYFYKRPYLYIDGFAQRGHRGLMQFTLIPENGPAFFRRHEQDFVDVYAYLMSLRPPQFPGRIDASLAEQGRAVFGDNCAECHGTYGEKWSYPNRRVPIEEIGTDPVRLSALEVAGRKKYAESWFAHGGEPGEQETIIDPDGYVAPPLDGVWASAPYFHNGSVPTLWGVLSPGERPEVWRRSAAAMDNNRIGLTVQTVAEIPTGIPDISLRRSYFDTKKFGKSNAGHDFGDRLDWSEKKAVLEYLKTL